MHTLSLTPLRLLVLSIIAIPIMTTDIKAHSFAVDRITADEGMVAALMEDTSQRYVDAMRSIVAERHTGPHGVRHWEALEDLMTSHPIARLEYRYKGRGGDVLRIYDGMDGMPLSQQATDILEGPSPPDTPDSIRSFDEWSSTPPLDEDRLATIDLDDNRHFPDDEARQRARIIRTEGSVTRPYAIDGSQRALDAEFKVTRQLEKDIQMGVVPRGGSVRLFTTNTLCNSCETALKTVSSAYDIDMRVTLLRQRLSPAERASLLSSGQVRSRGARLVRTDNGRPYLASDVVVDARERQVRRVLKPMFRSGQPLPSMAGEPPATAGRLCR